MQRSGTWFERNRTSPRDTLDFDFWTARSFPLKSVTIIEQALTEGLCLQLSNGQLASKLNSDGHSKKSRATAIEQAWKSCLKAWSESGSSHTEILQKALQLDPQTHHMIESLPPSEDAPLWSLQVDSDRLTLVRRSPELSQPAILT